MTNNCWKKEALKVLADTQDTVQVIIHRSAGLPFYGSLEGKLHSNWQESYDLIGDGVYLTIEVDAVDAKAYNEEKDMPLLEITP